MLTLAQSWSSTENYIQDGVAQWLGRRSVAGGLSLIQA